MIETTIVDFLPPICKSVHDLPEDCGVFVLSKDFQWIPIVSSNGRFWTPVECVLSQVEFQNQLPELIRPMKEKKEIGTIGLVVGSCDEHLITFGIFFVHETELDKDLEDPEVIILNEIELHIRKQKLKSFK